MILSSKASAIKKKILWYGHGFVYIWMIWGINHEYSIWPSYPILN